MLTVTADDAVRGLNGANPSFTYAYSAFLEDTPSDIDTSPIANTTATAASPAGDYSIILTGGTDKIMTSLTLRALSPSMIYLIRLLTFPILRTFLMVIPWSSPPPLAQGWRSNMKSSLNRALERDPQ